MQNMNEINGNMNGEVEGGNTPNYQARRDYYLMIENKRLELEELKSALIDDIHAMWNPKIQACDDTIEKMSETVSEGIDKPYMLCEHMTLDDMMIQQADRNGYVVATDYEIKEHQQIAMMNLDTIKPNTHYQYEAQGYYDDLRDVYADMLDNVWHNEIECDKCNLIDSRGETTLLYLSNLVAWQNTPQHQRFDELKMAAQRYFVKQYNERVKQKAPFIE